jgi:hypothetical protein
LVHCYAASHCCSVDAAPSVRSLLNLLLVFKRGLAFTALLPHKKKKKIKTREYAERYEKGKGKK